MRIPLTVVVACLILATHAAAQRATASLDLEPGTALEATWDESQDKRFCLNPSLFIVAAQVISTSHCLLATIGAGKPSPSRSLNASRRGSKAHW